MTKLSNIDGHQLWLYCHCGHVAGVLVSDLLARVTPETTVDRVKSQARCSKCDKRNNVKDVRIAFPGAV